MISFPTNTRIWIAAGVTDMRRGFTGLSAMVQTALEQIRSRVTSSSSTAGAAISIKLLWFDGDGLCLLRSVWSVDDSSGRRWRTEQCR